MTYTTKQLADIAGVTVRTLHHYDAIGLLEPEMVSTNGYRQYTDAEAKLLQQIMFFRELEFSLEEIKDIVHSPHYRSQVALEEQRELLKLKRKRLSKLINTIDTTLTRMKHAETEQESLADEFEAFERKNITEYKAELQQKYDPVIVQQSNQRVSSWSREHKAEVIAEGKAIVARIAEFMSNNESAESDSVQQEIVLYHKHMNNFYDCSLEIFQGLGEMYVQDPRFTKHYETVATGLAQYVSDAITFYCNQSDKPS